MGIVQNRKASLIFKIISVFICAAGLASASGILQGHYRQVTFFYYTNLSNLFCLLYWIAAVLFCVKAIHRDGVQGALCFVPRIKGAVVVMITITMIIFWLFLATGGASIDSIVRHLLVPILMILDWILFDPIGKLRKTDPFVWLLIPVAYYLFIMFVAQTDVIFYNGTSFPYFFLNYIQMGWGKAVAVVFFLGLGFMLLGFLMVGLNFIFEKKMISKNK